MNQALQLYELSLVEDHHQESHDMGECHPHRESLSTMDDLCHTMLLSESFGSDDLGLAAKGEDDQESVGSASTCEDPLIGITICIPKEFDLDFAIRRKQKRIFPAVKRTMSKDMPISMSASGRNVSMRRHSLNIPTSVPVSISSDDDEVDDARIHSRARRESQLSLPAMACSYEDRFAGSSVSMKGKVDKLMPTPVKRRRDLVSHKIASSVPTLSPMLF